jgi:hypothetical protein
VKGEVVMVVKKTAKAQSIQSSSNNADDSEQSIIFTQLRISEDTFMKSKILASIYDISFNAFVLLSIKNEIQNYENEHGELPKPIKLGQ